MFRTNLQRFLEIRSNRCTIIHPGRHHTSGGLQSELVRARVDCAASPTAFAPMLFLAKAGDIILKSVNYNATSWPLIAPAMLCGESEIRYTGCESVTEFRIQSHTRNILSLVW